MTQPHSIDREAVGVLIAKLRAVESSREPSDWSGIRQVTTNWYRNPDGPDAADMIEALFSRPPMEAVAWREKVARIIEDNVEAERRGPGDGWLEVVGIYDAADAILALIATHPVQGGEG